MTRTTILAASAALALLATPLIAQTAKEQTKKLSEQAQTFVTKAANGGMFEVESSKLAKEQAKREDVKSFAQKMIDDHGKANKELQSVATEVGAKVPEKMDQRHQSMLDKLKKTPQAQFDQAYINAQADAHREAVQLFSSYAKTGDNAELKQFAGKTLPVLQGHQAQLAELEKASSAATGKSSGQSGKGK